MGSDIVLSICCYHSKRHPKSQLPHRTAQLFASVSDFNSFGNVRSKSFTSLRSPNGNYSINVGHPMEYRLRVDENHVRRLRLDDTLDIVFGFC